MEFESSEPYPTEDYPWGEDEESFEPESDFYPEFDPVTAAGAAYLYNRFGRRSSPPRPRIPVKGVQNAIVKTPAGEARIELPSRVTTVDEFKRTTEQLQRSMQGIEQRLRYVSMQVRKTRREARAGSSMMPWLFVLEQAKDVARAFATEG